MKHGSITEPLWQGVPGVARSIRVITGSRNIPSTDLDVRRDMNAREHIKETSEEFDDDYRRRELHRGRTIHKGRDETELCLPKEASPFRVDLGQPSFTLTGSESEPRRSQESPALLRSIGSSSGSNSVLDGALEGLYPHKDIKYFCPFEGCPRSKIPTNSDKGRSFGPREDLTKVHIRTRHEKKAIRSPSLKYLSLRSSETLNWRQGRTPRGRKKILAAEQRSNAALMRIIGACTKCQKRTVKICDPRIPCRSCADHELGTSCRLHDQHDKQILAHSPHRRTDMLQDVRAERQDFVDQFEQRIRYGNTLSRETVDVPFLGVLNQMAWLNESEVPNIHAHHPNSALRKGQINYTISVDDTKDEGARSRMQFMALRCDSATGIASRAPSVVLAMHERLSLLHKCISHLGRVMGDLPKW